MPVFDTPLNTNDQSVERVLAAGLPVLLVIHRGTIAPELDAALKQVAKSEAGDLLVAKLDAADNPQTATRITGSLPALVVYQNNEETARATPIDAQRVPDYVAFALGRGPRPVTPQSAPPRSGNGHSQRTQRASNAPAAPVTVSDATFQREVLDSDLPVLVDLWAPWCGPCRMIAPVVEKLAREYSGRLKVAKLNVDENQQTSMRFQVQGIPTLLIFRGGQIVDRIVGAAPEPQLRSRVDAVLRSA